MGEGSREEEEEVVGIFSGSAYQSLRFSWPAVWKIQPRIRFSFREGLGTIQALRLFKIAD